VRLLYLIYTSLSEFGFFCVCPTLKYPILKGFSSYYYFFFGDLSLI